MVVPKPPILNVVVVPATPLLRMTALSPAVADEVSAPILMVASVCELGLIVEF